MKNSLRYILTLLSLIFIISCAKRSSITGGPKDETPPVFLKATPPNFSTSFNNNEIKIYFDELVTIQDVQQILISPPMQVKPEITPVGYPSKFVKIKFKEALLDSTTYSINFGSSIVDNNEKNPLTFFKYTFSTGKILDSLTFNGTIKDALKTEVDKNISVHLYELNENYKDSLVFKEYPRYVTNTLDSTGFKFENLKAGKYKLIALNDAASNYLYEPEQDKIGFINDTIIIPRDSSAVVTLFKKSKKFKYVRAKQKSKNEFLISYEGLLKNPEIEILDAKKDSLDLTFFKQQNKDTLQVFVKPFFEQDSIVFYAKSAIKNDTLVSRYKDQYKDSLKISPKNTTVKLNEDFVLNALTPFQSFEKSNAQLFKQDSIPIDFKFLFDQYKNELKIRFNKTENTEYKLQLIPNCIQDFLGNTNDSIQYNFRTLANSEYGNLFLEVNKLSNNENYILQLLSDKEVVFEEIIENSDSKKINISNLSPKDYQLRIVYDKNKNGKIDSGNFLEGLQPEFVYFFNETITIRANWDINQSIDLK